MTDNFVLRWGFCVIHFIDLLAFSSYNALSHVIVFLACKSLAMSIQFPVTSSFSDPVFAVQTGQCVSSAFSVI